MEICYSCKTKNKRKNFEIRSIRIDYINKSDNSIINNLICYFYLCKNCFLEWEKGRACKHLFNELANAELPKNVKQIIKRNEKGDLKGPLPLAFKFLWRQKKTDNVKSMI